MQKSASSSLQGSPEVSKHRPVAESPSRMQVDEEFKLQDITTLTKNAVRDICDAEKQAEVREKRFFVQALDVKVFSEQDNKKNIKQR